jgi:leucyl-tRNA synthetase
MTDRWIPQEIEPKWQRKWEADDLHRAQIDPSRPKFYAMTMYPYPSGELHIGHWFPMAPSDVRARWLKMKGYNVVFPMGFDSFGLPAENAAIKRGIHPKEWTYANIDRMRAQMRSMGAMFDWERECVTSDPEYYQWSEWFFLKLYDKGLAYKKEAPVDFCPHCNTTLAREQVWGEDRHCERCGTPVIKKDLDQWFFKITAYADELLDFSKMEWPDRVTTMQRNWIGRSEGAEVVFRTEHGGHQLPIFTTRPDTLWGATFMVLAPEHPLVEELTTNDQRAEVGAYVEQARRMTDIDREAVDREKTGVFTGAYAINPVNEERIPIWVADYVVMTYGTGAIMAVPCGDQRDFEFAQKYDLPIPVVVAPKDWDGGPFAEAYVEPGTMVNSGQFDGYPTIGKYSLEEWSPELAEKYGLPVDLTPETEGVRAVTRWLEDEGNGKFAVTYRLHDWLISHQRYWGAPIPMIQCPTCGIVPVPYGDLPVLLPEDVQFMPTGESPLKFHEGFRYVKCPECDGEAERETDTMDTFMCSSWYQYAYMERHWKGGETLSPDDMPFNPDEGAYWLPVDQYTGGIEHATMHLLYTRFFTKAMRDMGIVDFDEPMVRLNTQGTILGEDGEKMSKSRGNVIAPDALVQQYGADVVRGYLMFGFRWDQGGPWSSTGVLGIQRFLERVWSLAIEEPALEKTQALSAVDEAQLRGLRRKQHQTIRKVTHDLERFSFNTMIAALMEYTNYLIKAKETSVAGTPAWDEAIETLLLLMAPSFPHISEELWARIDQEYSIHQQAWPTWDDELAAEETITIVVQVNGKVRDRFDAPADIGEEDAKAQALATPGARKFLADKQTLKVIYVPGRLVNIVVK